MQQHLTESWQQDSEKPKVVYVTEMYPAPSAQNYGIFLHRSILQLRKYINPLVIQFRSWKPTRLVHQWRSWEDVPILTLSLPQFPGGSYFHINAQLLAFLGLFFVRQILTRADLVHSLSLYTNGYVAARWCHVYKKPHISHAIGSDVNEFLRLSPNSNRWNWLEHVHAVICNSADLGYKLVKYSGKLVKCETVYRGVDTDFFRPGGGTIGPQANKPPVRFLFLGGFAGVNGVKGGQVLLDAWKRAEERVGSSTLAIGGPKSENAIL